MQMRSCVAALHATVSGHANDFYFSKQFLYQEIAYVWQCSVIICFEINLKEKYKNKNDSKTREILGKHLKIKINCLKEKK